MKPTLFIGSSSEESDYALALQSQLTSTADVTVWSQGFFTLNKGYLESLTDGLNDSDFGVFVFAPDDILKLRGKTLAAVRDNVLFELGLFMGKLGRDRAFFVLPDNQKGLRLPSDLLGVSAATFDASRANIEAALGPACFRIRQAIKKFGVRQDRLAPPTVEIINHPRVLCVCSPQYFHLSFQKDVELIRNETHKISARVSELHSADSTSLAKTLMENEFDIVHISAYVDPKTGDIYFNDVGSDGAPAESVTIDSMSAITFSKLIDLTKAKLVVLATCDSLILAAKLAKVTNMIAAGDWISCDDVLKWELGLYKCLSKGVSLSNAFETATSLSKAPMLLLLKKDLALIG